MLQESNKKLLKKRPPILIVAILAIFIAIAVISIIHISKAKEVEFISVKDNFKADENLVFRFKYRGNGDYKDLSIKVIVFNYKGEEVRQIYPQLEYGENGEILVDLTQYFKQIKPGKYRLKFEIEDKNNGKTYVENKDFTWGVLAINVNKSIYPVRNIISNGVYLPNERAYLQMAVLNDSGHTICDANLKLEIISANGEQFSVTVQRSGECGPDNVTDVPDYFAYYQIPDKTGVYEMKLTNLDNGYEIIDSFEVKKEVPFDIERIGPTRIYPPASYQMTLRVKVNQDFIGKVIESVPESFKILNAKPYTLNPGQIIWNVDWKAGENYEIKYQFDAPDVSPYLYLLGPLELFSVNQRSNQRLPRVSEGDLRGESAVFAEQRRWQIAADAAPAGEWWDTAYGYRQKVTVTTGANSPSGGYNGYTARVSGFDTAALVTAGKMQADCDDLRIAYWNGSAWAEVVRHAIDCNTTATDVRFKLQADIAASSSDDNYYIYYGNSGATAPTALGTTNVYLWWDDASQDRESSYTQGRIDDSAHGGAWGNSVAWNAGGYYTYATGDNFSESMRPTGITERDVYVEYEFYHITGYPTNMTSGPLARWTGTGSGATEVSSGHYYYELAWSANCPGCGGAYASHDDITQTNRGGVVLANGTMGTVAVNVWTKVGLAAWLVNNTNLKAFFDTTPTTAEIGGFGATARFSGTHAGASDTETAGQAGAWLQQDDGRVRNILIRRYVEPEPTTARSAEEEPPAPTFNQSAYRLFNNLNSTDVGTALAAQDTAATLGATGDAFRLRMLLHVSDAQLGLSGQNFKLQFAQQSSTCDTGFVGETYADVTAATVIAYNNNTTPADGDNLTDNANDPVHSGHTNVNQDYEELNNFTNSVAAIPAGQDGLWDFALKDNNATANTAYCFRAVKSDATVLDTYTVIPQITTAGAGAPAEVRIKGSTRIKGGTRLK